VSSRRTSLRDTRECTLEPPTSRSERT
jgi:hypothetical protein